MEMVNWKKRLSKWVSLNNEFIPKKTDMVEVSIIRNLLPQSRA